MHILKLDQLVSSWPLSGRRSQAAARTPQGGSVRSASMEPEARVGHEQVGFNGHVDVCSVEPPCYMYGKSNDTGLFQTTR